MNPSNGATNASASEHDIVAGNSGSSNVGSGAGSTTIVAVATTASLLQLSVDNTVYVIVISPPHCVKFPDTSPGT